MHKLFKKHTLQENEIETEADFMQKHKLWQNKMEPETQIMQKY
jgi:hypothetical protein